MALNKFTVIDERWIPAQLFCDLRMAVHELIEVGQFLAAVTLFASIKTLFLAHHSIGILAEILLNARVFLQELLQVRMVFDELLVVHQRRIFAQLPAKLRMSVEEAVEAR